jgi:Protein of unknown function (DUF2889)
MALSPAPPRRHLHTRKTVFRGYEREDGLWDIEAELHDSKTYELKGMENVTLQPGEPVHHMFVRVTIDASMTVIAIETEMASAPFPECQSARDPMRGMIGKKMGPGWRQAIEAVLENICGCAHLREMLFNMATAAYQTTSSRRQGQAAVAPDTSAVKDMPHHLHKCMAWDLNGPVVQRHYPEFFGATPYVGSKPKPP